MRLLVWWAAVAASAASRLRQGLVKDNADFELRLDNFDGVQYSAAFSLGEQTLPVIYDTGSFEIIVLSTLCASCSRAHIVYNSSKSTSFAASEGIMAEHLFGSGPVRSEKGYEMVRLGGRGSPYKAANTPFWQVISHNIAVWDRTSHFSGIVGLGHPGQVPSGFSAEETEADSMLSAMQISSFAICLERGQHAPGWLSVGPKVQALAESNPSFQALTVLGKNHWGVKMTNLRIPGLSTTSPCVPSCGAIVDSGTSLIAAPPTAAGLVSDLARLVRSDCSNLHSLPVLQMELDGKVVELPPAAYVIKTSTRVSSNSSIMRRMFSASGSETIHRCTVGFMTLEKDSQMGPVWILGMPFLRYHYTVFDRASKTIHIAPSTPSCQISGKSMSLINTTSHAGTGEESDKGLSSRFTVSDYEPTEVDLNAARISPWATTSEREMSF